MGDESSPEVICADKFIGDGDLEKLVDKLIYSTKKTKLVLRGNNLSPISAKSIGKLFKLNHSIEFISLEWNQLGAGIRYLADPLTENTSILHLDLRNNGIHDDDIVDLAKALEKNKTLQLLDLRWNLLTDKGVEMFCSAIMNRVPHLIIHFSGNHLSPTTLNQIDDWNRGNFESTNKFNQSQSTNPETNNSTNDSDDDNQTDINLTNQQQIMMQMKIKHSMLTKEIKTMRQQNIHLQTTISSMETQLCNDSLRYTELEMQLRIEMFKSEQLRETVKDLSEKLKKSIQDRDSAINLRDNDRSLILQETSEVVRNKDMELRSQVQQTYLLKDQLFQAERSRENEVNKLTSIMETLESDKLSLQQELRTSSTRIIELSHEESRLKALNNSLETTIKRLQEKLECVEEESLLNQRLAEESLLAEMKRHDAELEKCRFDATKARSNQDVRVQKLVEEITFIRSRGLEMEQTLTNQLITVQIECDKKIEQTRQQERFRTELMISDLKQRSETSLELQKESDERASQYLRELQKTQKEHETITDDLKVQLKAAQVETNRLRSINDSLRESTANSLKEASLSSLQLERTIAKQREQEEDSVASKRALERTMAENHLLKKQIENLEGTLAKEINNKEKDFKLIEEEVQQSFLRQFENLRIKLLPMTISNGAHVNTNS